MMSIKYLCARQQDCNYIADWVNTIGQGHIEYIFDGLIAGRTPLQQLALVLSKDENYTYKNVDLAMTGDCIIGLVFSYLADVNVVTQEMKNALTEDRLEWLRIFSDNQINNSWYINTLGVKEEYRRRGIARKLLDYASQRALKNGLQCLSLHVYDGNTAAIDLYKTYGFTEENRVNLVGHPFSKARNLSANILMKCNLPVSN